MRVAEDSDPYNSVFHRLLHTIFTFIFFLSYANTKSGIVTKIEFNRNQLGSNTEIFKVDFLTHIGDRILPNTKGMRYTIFVFGIVHTESLREFEREIDKVNSACILEVI